MPPPAERNKSEIDETFSPPTVDEIIQQQKRIFESDEFHATESQRNLLDFVIQQTISGESENIKGYTIATQVFGRNEKFNQSTDPIVSIQANKLRRALERYYLVAGRRDAIVIDIPKGGFVPEFRRKAVEETVATARAPRVSVKKAFEDAWPSVLIQPFQNLVGDPEKGFLGIGLSTDLAIELTRYQEIRVLFPLEGNTPILPFDTPRFVLSGTIYCDGASIKIAAYLTDNRTGKCIWGDTHKSPMDVASLLAFQEKAVWIIAAKIGGEAGVIPKLLHLESKAKPPTELSTYEAILRFYEYDQTFTRESFIGAMTSLERAADKEPACGQVWCLLGRLYANAYSLGFEGIENPLEKAVAYVEKGVYLDPDDQRSLAALSLVRFLSNELPSAIAEAERALAMNPNSLLMMDGLAYILMLSGVWEKGAVLARDAIKFNPYYRNVIHYALWADWLRREKYEQAYMETLRLRRPAVFWHPLAKAATLGLLGRYEEGKKYVGNLLELKPDFANQGRMLIGHYVKFDEIFNRIAEGLGKVGLEIQ